MRPDLPVTVIGTGVIANELRRTLPSPRHDDPPAARPSRPPPSSPPFPPFRASGASRAVLVAASDGWTSAEQEQRLRARARAADASWLPVHTELGALIIGPVEDLGGDEEGDTASAADTACAADTDSAPPTARAGCVHCARLRRDRLLENPPAWRILRERHGTELAERPSGWLTGLALRTTAALVYDEVRALAGQDVRTANPRTRNAILRVRLADLTVQRHPFLPDPTCPVCGDLPEDSAERARITPRPRPKPNPNGYRIRSMARELERLTELYVDESTGLIRSVRKGEQGGLVVATAAMPLRFGDLTEPGAGHGRGYRRSAATAILEALERYGGGEPGGSRTVVEGSMADLLAAGHRVLDPRTLGVHPPECYQRPDYRFRQFGEEQRARWVWGYSFGQAEPILVPESCAYYYLGLANRHADRPFVFEVSNGCAIGGCLQEAILFGLLEAVERDGFLLTWYARIPAPRIDLDSAIDRTIPLQRLAIEQDSGYRVRVFDTTMEHGIPSVWAIALRPDHAQPDPSDPRPMSISAAGAHVTLELATLDALDELGPIARTFPDEFAEVSERARKMAYEPALVARMRDHAPLYGTRQGFERLRFLVDTPYRARLDSARARPVGFGNPDLAADLTEAVGRVTDAGMDVVVVDQTTPEHRAGGLCCVKVLMPGAMPMTFGYEFRRIHDLTRPLTVPRLLGYRSRDLRLADLNPHPHPFP